MGILLDRNGGLNGCALLALLIGIMAGGSLIVVAAVDGGGQAAPHMWLDAMAERGWAGGGGGATEYERAGIVASLYDMAGDEWAAAAAAHRRAALSAENAAAEWTEVAELLGGYAAGHGTGYERVRAAEARAAEWLSAGGAARGMAAEAAAEAGYRRAAAEARAGAAGIAAGADAADADRRVASMMDRRAGAERPRAPPSLAAAADVRTMLPRLLPLPMPTGAWHQ